MHNSTRRAALGLLRRQTAAGGVAGGASAAAAPVARALPYVQAVVVRGQQTQSSNVNQESMLSGTAGTYLEEMYEAWSKDPSSVHSSWDAYFRGSAYATPPNVGATKANEGETLLALLP